MIIECKFCKRKIDRGHREYLSNPFCTECYEERLEASGAIDLRDNQTIIDHENGYNSIVPIVSTKVWKAGFRND